MTDPAGKWKTYTSDAMGNLIHVTEPAPEGGTHETSYAYNLLNQMTTVSMPRNTTSQGLVIQTRSFNYDLTTARLTSATNPENSTVSYTYNTDGTLSQKTDAKNQKIQYTYDTYGRLTEKRAYQGSTEDLPNRVDYTYNTLGQLASAQWGLTTGTPGQFLESYGYGAGGLMTSKTLQLTQGVRGSQTVNFSYNPEGQLSGVSLTNIYLYNPPGCSGYPCYPQQTGPNYVYSFDTLGRSTQLQETVSQSVMANNVSYGGPSGQLSALTWTIPPIPLNQDSGIQFNETRLYNPRGQMTRLKYSAVLSGEPLPNVDQTYTFSSTANDGRITQMTDAISGEVVQYQYDSLGRLTLAQTTGPQWGESFTYDGFGNLTSEVATQGTAFTSYQNYDATTNRLVGGGASYDANGNLTAMAGGLTMSYDEENRMVQAVNSSSTTETDVYNPSGQLVYRQQGSATPEVYMFGPQRQRMRFFLVLPTWSDGNRLLFTYQDQELYFAGKLLETDDRLGTSVVTASGWTAKTYPYGELREALPSYAGGRYATYLLDSTTNLNYARNRWYSSQVARFTTVDPSGRANLGAPQSWNRYAYVMGDPVNFSDPSGLDQCSADYGTPCYTNDGPALQTQGDTTHWQAFGLNPFASWMWDHTSDLQFWQAMGADPAAATARLSADLSEALRNLGQQCRNAINTSMTQAGKSPNRLWNLPGYVYFYNVSSPSVGNLLLMYVSGSLATDAQGKPMTLAEYATGAYAAVLTDLHGKVTNQVVVTSAFIHETPSDQANTLVHEALHIAFGADDVGLAEALGLLTEKQVQSGWSGGFNMDAESSELISAWLQQGCPPR